MGNDYERNRPILAIICPCYNEEEVVEESYYTLSTKLRFMIEQNLISNESFILFIDDGSHDKTWEIIDRIQQENNKILKLIKLSRNYGHQYALLAGMMATKNLCDLVISVDIDLQDDINIFDKFIELYKKGYEIIYGVKKNRDTDGYMKKVTAETYYKLLKIMGVSVIYNHADFRAVSNKVLNELSKYQESELFLRGIIPSLGYKSTTIEYEVNSRKKGKSKYTIKKMVGLAWTGITSFTAFPLRVITIIGFLISVCTIIYSIYIIIVNTLGITVAGWSSITILISLLGGLQLFSIGLMGEYIAKIYMEVKKRPRYIISEYRGINDRGEQSR